MIVVDAKVMTYLVLKGDYSNSGYDSQYIALAEDLGLKLFTFDKKILSNSGSIAIRPGDRPDVGLGE
jgi:hypothetical protein